MSTHGDHVKMRIFMNTPCMEYMVIDQLSTHRQEHAVDEQAGDDADGHIVRGLN